MFECIDTGLLNLPQLVCFKTVFEALGITTTKKINRCECILTLGTFVATIIIKHLNQPWWIPLRNPIRSLYFSMVTGQSVQSCRLWFSGTFPLNQRLYHFDSIIWLNSGLSVLYWSTPALCFLSDMDLHPDQEQRYADKVNRQALSTVPRQGLCLLFILPVKQEEMKLINMPS